LKKLPKRYHLLFILAITIVVVQIILTLKYKHLKKLEEKELKDHSKKIENCIDIKNNNKRTFYENIRLSEYCIDNFGSI
tara:strand:- start:127 stop:363 length:237 start_codon:yes stop_codon:yes gene_type:complete